jgi:hypothetical protein
MVDEQSLFPVDSALLTVVLNSVPKRTGGRIPEMNDGVSAVTHQSIFTRSAAAVKSEDC